MPMNLITGSVQMTWRLSASWFGNIRCATVWLMIATGSLPLRSRSLKSRPAMIGTPSAAKNPGETMRNCPRGSSSAVAAHVPFGRELQAGSERAALAPRREHAESDPVHARQLAHAPHRFFIEVRQPARPSAHTTSQAR